MTPVEIRSRIQIIDKTVAKEEKLNDQYMAQHGKMNRAIYDHIQRLMDEREKLYIILIRLEETE